MASSSGMSSGSMMSSAIQNSGSDEDLRSVMDQRKRKRMISNRESARRSRMRKRKHLDELVSQVGDLLEENRRIAKDLNIIAQDYSRVASENSVLRAQADELIHRLQSLDEIIGFLSANCVAAVNPAGPCPAVDGFTVDPVSFGCLNQPILASANMIEY